MSLINQFSSTLHDDRMIPLDQRYTDFLNALSDIHDESMRDRCHKYWTSLYRYFDRSMTNEQALIVEEKRTHEILHRLDIEMVSHQSEIAYQVRHILQRGHQVLADLHIKYDRKKNSLREIKQHIDDLENRIQKKKSEHSFTTDFTSVPSSTSLNQITETIDNLKLHIKNLQMTRENFQTELNIQRTNHVLTQTKAYRIQQNIHKTKKELMEIQHELTINLEAIHQGNNQLNELHHHKQNISISIDQDYLNVDHQSLKEQLKIEEKLLLELKKQNKELTNTLSYQMTILKTNTNKQTELKMNNKDLIKEIHIKHEEIEKEKDIKQELLQIATKLKIELKRKQKILSTHHRQENKLKNQIIELEHKRDIFLQQPTIPSCENPNIKKTIHQEINHRLKLTLIHHHLKHQINTLENTTQEYTLLVKEQRQKVINYEKSHDKWILHINIHRNRLLELFNRINIIEQSIINTNKFLQQFDHIKFSLRPKILILYNQINLFIQQKREKNDLDVNINLTGEGINSLNLKFYQLNKILQSNQIIFHQTKQNLSLVNQNHSILFNQISTINKQRFHLTQHLDYLQNKFLVKQQQVLNIFNKFHHIKQTIELNHQKFQRFTSEKQTIIPFLLKKQHLIVLINQQIKFNEKNLIKHRSCYDKLMNKIRQLRTRVLREIQQIKSIDRQHQPNLKQLILHLRTELLEYKKKTNDFQHRINRRHITRQILTKFNDKSIVKVENNEQSRMNLQQKASSIIYRLICKTYYNIILHKRLDLLRQTIILLYYTDQQSFKNSSLFSPDNSFHSAHLDNQLKSYIAELRVLKYEILICKQTYANIKYSLENSLTNTNRQLSTKKTGTELCDA